MVAASSEVTGQHQKDMFFNEAESLGAQAEPAAEEPGNDGDDEGFASQSRSAPCLRHHARDTTHERQRPNASR